VRYAPMLLAWILASPGECYLVTSARIEPIPCKFDAASTDALRYAAREEDRKREASRQGSNAPSPWSPGRAGPAYGVPSTTYRRTATGWNGKVR
jgi:hypothetical protein